MKKYLFLLLLTLSSCSMFDPNVVKVIEVNDGDTLKAKNNQGEEIKVRLACIDAPEMSQTLWGEEAKKRLQKLVPVNSSVKLKVVDQDNYGRFVAEIYKGNNLINLKMVKEGKAFVYDRYLYNCDGEKYKQAQETAKKKKKGIWKEKNPQKPWIFRMLQRNK
ncbi:thermonuclease family protein [Cyanobacterium aponinum]|uniref:Thermonuclease family protein n=1 Tax=Cyanobacterium aponinum 0216 TaxID=2676140 RepID=A0A844GM30_9CHRO|nr:thermonuclease family protein [Cyanobacterium aponinum]MTF37527.1 thermonuclease family protein [Cyanobacterium aponinum 0216]PHV63740.1 nuclease [Cyanobacterium aponinum IPPAS B-1201]